MNVKEYNQHWSFIIGIVDEFRRNPELVLEENIFKLHIANAFYAGVDYFRNSNRVQNA